MSNPSLFTHPGLTLDSTVIYILFFSNRPTHHPVYASESV